MPDDLGGIVGLTTGSRQQSILAALGNYEWDVPGAGDQVSGGKNLTRPTSHLAHPSVLRYDASAGSVAPGADLPPFESSSGPLALGDIDGDGQLDLFVGGRVLPGRYPEAASSRIYRGHYWPSPPSSPPPLSLSGF